MCTPNIFSYATSELSQDAFICWLIACASEATGHLQACGLDFVRTLFRSGASNGTTDIPVLDPDGNPTIYNGPCEVSDVGVPYPQYNRIDVYFQAQVDGHQVSFLIEDKTGSEQHSNQLERYLEGVINDEQEESLIKSIYFKTGYVFNDERDAVTENNYSVFEAEDMQNFLNGHPDAIRENQILCQYVEYLNDQVQTRAEALANWDLDQDNVQWEFMKNLRGVLRQADNEWQHFVPRELSGEPKWEKPHWNWKGLLRGNNRDGSPWTQYWFSKHLFWRLDAWRPLLLRIYHSEAGMIYDDDKVQEYRRHFNKALEQAGLCSGGVRMRRGNECTIGSVDIVNETANLQGLTMDEFLDRVMQVHTRFLERSSS